MSDPVPRRLAIPAALASVQAVAISWCLYLQRPSAPILYTDETGFLTAAWHFSTRGGAAVLPRSPFYSPGYSMLLAPVLSVSTADAWKLAVGFNMVCGLLIPIVLWRFATDVLDLSARAAALAAGAAGLYPAIMIQSSRAWPEVLLTLWVCAWAWFVGRYLLRRSIADGAVAGALAGLSYAVHHRTIGLIALTIVVGIVVAARERRHGRVTSVALVAATVVGTAVSVVCDRLLLDAVYGATPYGLTDRARFALDWAGVGDMFERVIGQVWYAQIASLGLLGLAVASQVVGSRSGDARRAATGVVLLGLATTIAIAAAFLSDFGRVDHRVYGRYHEVWMPLVITIGIAFLLDHRDSLRSFVMSAVSVLAIVPLTGLLVAFEGSDGFTGDLSKITIPVAAAWDLLAGDRGRAVTNRLDVWVITFGVVVVGLAVLALVARFGERAVPALAAVFLALGLAASGWSFRPWFDIFESNGVEAARVIDDAGVTSLAYTTDTRSESLNGVQYRSGYPVLELIDPAGPCPRSRFVLAPEGTEFAFATQRVIALEPFGGALFETEC
jgi:hypothetical protein